MCLSLPVRHLFRNGKSTFFNRNHNILGVIWSVFNSELLFWIIFPFDQTKKTQLLFCIKIGSAWKHVLCSNRGNVKVKREKKVGSISPSTENGRRRKKDKVCLSERERGFLPLHTQREAFHFSEREAGFSERDFLFFICGVQTECMCVYIQVECSLIREREGPQNHFQQGSSSSSSSS